MHLHSICPLSEDHLLRFNHNLVFKLCNYTNKRLKLSKILTDFFSVGQGHTTAVSEPTRCTVVTS